MKCIVPKCDKDAEYVYFGKSLCKRHFDEFAKEVEKADKKIKKPQCNRTLHHRGGIFHCLRELGHEADGHRFEVPDVDTKIGR